MRENVSLVGSVQFSPSLSESNTQHWNIRVSLAGTLAEIATGTCCFSSLWQPAFQLLVNYNVDRMLFKDYWPFLLKSWATRKCIQIMSIRIGTHSVCHVIGGSNSAPPSASRNTCEILHFPIASEYVTVYIMSATSSSRRPEIHFNFHFKKNLVITNLKEILSFVPTLRSSLRKLRGKYRKFYSISQPWPRLLSKSSFV